MILEVFIWATLKATRSGIELKGYNLLRKHFTLYKAFLSSNTICFTWTGIYACTINDLTIFTCFQDQHETFFLDDK